MLKQKFLVQFGSNIFLKIIGMVAGIIVARVAGPEVVGTIAYGTAYVSIFGFVVGLFGTGHIKLISEGRDLGNCVTTYSWLQLGSIGFFAIVVGSYYLAQKYIFHHVFESRIHEQVIILILLASILTKLIEFSNVTFTAQLKQAKANAPNLIRGFLFQIGRVVVVLLGFKAVGLASWNMISAAITIPIAIYIYRTLPFGKFDKQIMKEQIAYAIPIFLVVMVNSLVKFSDKLLLHKFTSTKELGYYSAAFSIGGLIILVGRTIGTIFFPFFSKMIAEGNWKSVNEKISKFEVFITIFIFPAVCLMAIISEPLLTTLLGEKYQPSVIPFSILLFASYFQIVGMPYGNIIPAMGRFYLSMWLQVLKFGVYILSVFIFIYPKALGLGAVGLALNLLTVNLLINLITYFTAKKIGEIDFSFRNYSRYILILVISGLFFWLSIIAKQEGVMAWPLYMVPAYMVLIYGLMYITGLVNNEQIKELFDLMKLGKVLKYVKSEIKEKP